MFDNDEYKREQHYLAAERQDDINKLRAGEYGGGDDDDDAEFFSDEPRDDTYDEPVPIIGNADDEDEALAELEPEPVIDENAPVPTPATVPEDHQPLPGYRGADSPPTSGKRKQAKKSKAQARSAKGPKPSRLKPRPKTVKKVVKKGKSKKH